MELYKRHGITQWRDATRIEIEDINSYDTFKDLVKDSPSPV